MSRLKYKYSLDKFGNVVSISEAKKGNVYYFGQTDIELIVKDGGTNRKHFSLKSGGSIDSLFSGGGESPEHYNAKYEIKKQGFFYWNDIKIKPSRIEIEYEFKTIDKISDVVFFDEDDNLMCVIEVYFTNKKRQKDIDDFKKLNTNVYEYNIKNGSTELLCWSVSVEQYRASEEENGMMIQLNPKKKRLKDLKRNYTTNQNTYENLLVKKEYLTENLKESRKKLNLISKNPQKELDRLNKNLTMLKQNLKEVDQQNLDLEVELSGLKKRLKTLKNKSKVWNNLEYKLRKLNMRLQMLKEKTEQLKVTFNGKKIEADNLIRSSKEISSTFTLQ